MNKFLLILLFSVVFTGCNYCVRNQPGGQEYFQIREIRLSDADEAARQFSSYTIEKQIDIYLFGIKYVHPNDNSGAQLLANQGSQKLPHIFKRIQAANSELEIAYLVEVVELINRQNCCVTDNEIEMLSQIGSTLTSEFQRARFEAAFSKIKLNKKGRS